MNKPTIAILSSVIIAFVCLFTCNDRNKDMANHLYDAYYAGDSITFYRIYANATPETIEIFEEYLKKDAEFQKELQADSIVRAEKRAAAKARWHEIKP